MSKSFQQELNAVPHSFSKIIFGTSTLKKAEKVYAAYHIPAGEDIAAYIKSTIPFMKPTVVITDSAIYSSSHEPVPFSELCRYLVLQVDAKAGVSLITAQSIESLLGGALILHNTAGTELVQLLSSMQQELVQNYEWARQQRDAVVAEILSATKKEMQMGTISPFHMAVLDSLAGEVPYCDEVALLKAEDIFRTCDLSAYQNFVNSLESPVSHDVQETIKNASNVFGEHLIRDLSNISLDFDSAFLNTVYGNLSLLTELSEIHCLALAYVCARLDKQEQFNSIREQVVRRFGADQVQNLAFFQGRYYNSRMQRIYDSIKNNTEPLAAWIHWTDSVGLTPLHYAIILHQEDIINQLLDEQKWEPSPPPSLEGDAAELYDYTLLACLCGVSNRDTIFQDTSELVAAQRKSRKALEAKLWLIKRKLDMQDSTIRGLKSDLHQARHEHSYDKERDVWERLDTASELRDETLADIDEIKQYIKEIDYEIQRLTQDAFVEAANTIQRLYEGNDPFIRYLFQLFTDSSFLYQVLSGSQGRCRIYTYGEFAFVTPANITLDLPYCEEGVAEQARHTGSQSEYNTTQAKEPKSAQDEPISKPYGTSWFSPEAHRNMKKLKEEYRALAKKYHPDCCTRADSKQLFQDILNERADILENMN
jgi:hypothetical protein